MLVCYDGKGLVDQEIDEEYWLPKDTEVDDGLGREQYSVVAKLFIDSLAQNKNSITSSELYLKVCDTVSETGIALGVNQAPGRGEFRNGGHEEPVFVFCTKFIYNFDFSFYFKPLEKMLQCHKHTYITR